MKCQFDVCLFDDFNRKSLLMNLRTDNCTKDFLERVCACKSNRESYGWLWNWALETSDTM